MKKYKYIIKKIQTCHVEQEFSGKSTIGENLDEISKKSEKELGFGKPSYHLHCVIEINGKIERIIYQSDSLI